MSDILLQLFAHTKKFDYPYYSCAIGIHYP